MKLEREDYIDPACPLCGKPGETESARPVPVDRIQRKLREYEDASDWAGAERHLKYWLAEAEMNREFGKLMARGCDVAILVGKKRSEAIAEGLRTAGFSEDNIHVADSLDDAAAYMRSIVHPGGTVLFENDLPDNYTE